MTVFIVLVDGFINVILFITNHDNYINWCINSTSTELEGGLSNATTNAIVNLDQDFYNCHRTWEDELKFGLLATLMMIGFYVSEKEDFVVKSKKAKPFIQCKRSL